MFNNWFDENNYPRQAECARVTLLPKQGKNLRTLAGYRTLSVGCNLSKLYLRILEQRLLKIPERCGILGEFQNGFRPGRRGADNHFTLYTINKIVKKKAGKASSPSLT